MKDVQGLRHRLSRLYFEMPVFYRVLGVSVLSFVIPLMILLVIARAGVLVQSSAYLFLGYFVLLLLLASLVNSILLRSLFLPVMQLSNAVEQLQSGEYDVQVPTNLDDPQLRRVSNVLRMIIETIESSRKYTSSRTLRALERERMRIARELHDETGQSLSSLVIKLEMIINMLQEEAVQSALVEEIIEQLNTTRDLTESTLEEIRKLIFDLRPSILDDLGLIPAMRWYAMNKLEDMDIDSRFQMQGMHERLPADTETALFRIYQEAVSNVIRHAEASLVVIAMKIRDDAVILSVKDDGVGFEPDEVAGDDSAYEGLGLFGMQERARLLGGRMRVDSVPGRGTEVKVQVPRP